MRNLNLGILAHVDAGKTSLTERLLYVAGAIDEIGKVDDGNTQTDTLALERRRGITIKSAVASFVVGDTVINLIDTPGHPDFIAEVERALAVLDGAVLVVSAVEGVQAQTRILMRALKRLGVPTLIFVNKIDRVGADAGRVLRDIGNRLTPAIIAMGDAFACGDRDAGFVEFDNRSQHFKDTLTEALAEHDDDVLLAFIDDVNGLSIAELRRILATQTADALVHPVFFGSAATGAGAEALLAGIEALLPRARADLEHAAQGKIFKIEREASGAKVAYVRMLEGCLKTREKVSFGRGVSEKVTAIEVFGASGASRVSEVLAGQIGKLWGLNSIQIGDVIGHKEVRSLSSSFAPPTLETRIFRASPGDMPRLYTGLSQLAEQDPLINLRRDDTHQEIFVSLYGEVQKEVIQQTLLEEFGVKADFRETVMICVERPVGTGHAVVWLKDQDNPFYATVGLRVEPASVNSGLQFALEVELGSIPLSFHAAVEETVYATLGEGLCGWRVVDCKITMTHSGFIDAVSTAGHFRRLTPLVLMEALKQAGTVVCAPVHRFSLEVPEHVFGAVLPLLLRLGASPDAPVLQEETFIVEGDIPADQVHVLQQRLPPLTHGEGLLETEFGHYEPVQGTAPTRPRTDHNPLNRKEYLLRLAGRIS